MPRVDAVVDAAAGLMAAYGRRAVTDAVRRAVDAARHRLLEGGGAPPEMAELVAHAEADLTARRPGPPRRVINATGVVIHTNLGRAPLGHAAVQAAVDAAAYCDLEYDLAGGQRGSRGARLDPLLVEATGAAAGLAVNNAAGALVLALATLAIGRAVPVSRGELIEIGGSFRMPDIMAASGARLVEVGTTNRTRPADYDVADDVALLLKVHPSNYRIEGFHEEPSVRELAGVAHDRGVPLLYDVGSGLLQDRAEPWLRDEPSIHQSLIDGADLVVCSGDKLLGGPQAGLLVGRADLVERCRRHPLARALRLDKLRIAALVVTLEAHLAETADQAVPVWAMLTLQPEVLRRRSARLAAQTGGTVIEGAGLVGGGSAPGARIQGSQVVLRCVHPDAVAARLRVGDPPVVVRIDEGGIVLDLRTVAEADDAVLSARVVAAVTEGAAGPQ
jgi:L-seryl-tRNA(Ser) seleniumtransferase